jgi:acetyl-CoA acyltransferase 1
MKVQDGELLMRGCPRFDLLSLISVISLQEATLPKLLMEVSNRILSRDNVLIIPAAAVLLMKRSRAIELGQPILAKFVGATVAGLAPRIMGIGPSIAIPKLLGKYNITINDCDIIEVNEAFASMAVYCKDVLKIPYERMNPRGGAIALGHPLGATGARQIVTGLSEARRQKKKILLTSMCIGTGQGMAGLFVNEQL